MKEYHQHKLHEGIAWPRYKVWQILGQNYVDIGSFDCHLRNIVISTPVWVNTEKASKSPSIAACFWLFYPHSACSHSGMAKHSDWRPASPHWPQEGSGPLWALSRPKNSGRTAAVGVFKHVRSIPKAAWAHKAKKEIYQFLDVLGAAADNVWPSCSSRHNQKGFACSPLLPWPTGRATLKKENQRQHLPPKSKADDDGIDQDNKSDEWVEEWGGNPSMHCLPLLVKPEVKVRTKCCPLMSCKCYIVTSNVGSWSSVPRLKQTHDITHTV